MIKDIDNSMDYPYFLSTDEIVNLGHKLSRDALYVFRRKAIEELEAEYKEELEAEHKEELEEQKEKVDDLVSEVLELRRTLIKIEGLAKNA